MSTRKTRTTVRHRSQRYALLPVSVSLAIMAGVAAPVYAASNAEIMEQLQLLQQRVEKVESQLKKTEDELVDTKGELLDTRQDLVDAQADATKSRKLKFSKTTGTPEIVSSDGNSSMALYGRVQLEAASIPDQYANGQTKEFVSDHTASEIRRARLGVEGKFHSIWEYDLEVDFAENDLDLKKALITYAGWDGNDLTAGFQRVAFGLENTGSSNYTVFMERGVTDAFSPDRDLGIAWRNHAGDWGQFKVGAYIPNSIDEGDDDNHRADAYNYIGRVSLVPINKSNQVVHLGASAAYTNYSNKDNVRYRTRPESHLSERLVRTDRIYDPDHTWRYGLEAAYSGSGFLLQSEYVGVSTKGYYDDEDKEGKNDTYDYSSWYASAAYMLTGEAHAYRSKGGTFGNVMPDHPISKGGWGAWELAARYSKIDLNDNGEKGGQMDDITLGLNWYLENNLKLMFNYVRYDADNYEDKDSRINDQNENIYQTRLQWFF